GQHACALATSLGIERVLLHPLAGVLSAWGIGQAPQSLLRERSLRRSLDVALVPQLQACVRQLVEAGREALRQAGDLGADQEPAARALLEIRTPARDQGLVVPWPGPQPASCASAAPALLTQLRQAFEATHRQRYGYALEGEDLVVERLVVEVVAPPRASPPAAGGGGDAGQEIPPLVPLCLPRPVPSAAAGGVVLAWQRVPLWRRECLTAGQVLAGPALVVEATGTTVLEPEWQARVLAGGELLLERTYGSPAVAPACAAAPVEASAPDPVRLELYNHRFSAIAEQMGVRLQQSSRSVNIRERLDFSCALFDASGALVANAPHIPVHLGSMGESVVALLAAVERGERPPLQPGDAVAANDPFHGGTHLPDITVITPVFAGAERPLFFVACRGHHGDVGGITPGSMPPFSRCIEDEGLLLDNVSLLSAGRFDAASWRDRLRAGPHPVRNPEQLLADLQAQVAANRLGVEELERLIAREGLEEVQAYMAHVQANAAEAVRRVIDGLHDGAHAVELDDGGMIRVAVRIDRAARRACVDFTGTSPQQPGNANAPLAITRAVVLYVFRCLVGQPIPLNAGCFEPLDLVVPLGCLLHPERPAAVVAGNVETSQAVANALFAALGVMAAAQGTMNNLSFGNDRCQYYETICGGTGAGVLGDGRGFAGADAVQSHMTNSRLTDPEILEDRFPVRLERFAVRRGSGGRGRWPGGSGVVRRLRFLEPMTVAILSGSRRVPPFGLAGGGPGLVGANRIERTDGTVERLGGSAQLEMAPGDVLEIATPGGGGYGAPEDASGHDSGGER
ncbi:MAG TPA: hydantoinase B/oxoprolinase family protein, partial [Cyanobium sp.]|nr:hydantoinase B/oxoprolinase family protein [Cyanobium sp.]